VTTERPYDIFPRTWKARLLLALAFLGGLCVIALYLGIYFLQLNARFGWFGHPPCTGSDVNDCIAAQTELAPTAQASCEGSGLRVCFVPLGQVDPDIVRNLVDYYRDQYGLRIGVLTPSTVPAEIVSQKRHQIDGPSLSDYMKKLFPADFADPNVVLIGLTPLDLYAHDEDWRFELGVADWSGPSHGLLSTYRMHVGGRLRLVSDERVLSRMRKMVTKYVGLMYYRLPLSNDPTSPLYGSIMSVSDLDKMREPLLDRMPLPTS
jgi:predicted Zn-dependent protease